MDRLTQSRAMAATSPPCLTQPALQSSTIVAAGEPYIGVVAAGDFIGIVDLFGNQAVDTLLFSRADPTERYSATDTIAQQGSIYLGLGTVLMSNEGRRLATIVYDTCGRHDTLGGACAAESNMVRYSLGSKYMHNCRDSFLLAIANWDEPRIDKRDLAANINFFMNVPVTPDGRLTFEDGISGAGKTVLLRAEMELILLVSNCPQLNNPCNGYDPTPVRIDVWREGIAHD